MIREIIANLDSEKKKHITASIDYVSELFMEINNFEKTLNEELKIMEEVRLSEKKTFCEFFLLEFL